MAMASGEERMSSPDAKDHRLLSVYQRYLGEPARTTDVFVGFALFFGGIAVGAIGLVVFFSSVVVGSGSLFWQLRELSIVLAILGLPAVLLSVVVLLPVSMRATYASLAGVGLCALAAGLFVYAYPQQWNVAGADYSPLGITIYASGLTALMGSTGAALVAHHLQQARADESTPDQPGRVDDTNESITDAEIQRDIDETTAATDLTWGGVEPEATKRLTLTQETGAEDLDASGFEVPADVRTKSGVDDSVAALRKLQGWEPKTDRGDGIDEQADALKQLREQSSKSDDSRHWLGDVVDRLRGQ